MSKEDGKTAEGRKNLIETRLSSFITLQEQWVADTLVQISILLFGFNIKRLSPWLKENGKWVGIEELRESAIKQAKELEGEVVKQLWMSGWKQ